MASVSVPQKSGEILVSRGGDPPVTYSVENGLVEVEDQNVASFLSQIPGSELSTPKPVDKSKTDKS